VQPRKVAGIKLFLSTLRSPGPWIKVNKHEFLSYLAGWKLKAQTTSTFLGHHLQHLWYPAFINQCCFSSGWHISRWSNLATGYLTTEAIRPWQHGLVVSIKSNVGEIPPQSTKLLTHRVKLYEPFSRKRACTSNPEVSHLQCINLHQSTHVSWHYLHVKTKNTATGHWKMPPPPSIVGVKRLPR